MRAFFAERRNGRRLALGLIVIAVLLVVDVVLIAFALRANVVPPASVAPPSPAGLPTPIDSQRPDPVAEPSVASPVPSAEPTGSESDVARLLSAVSDTVAWRAEVGRCGDPGTFEVTTDGGATWAAAGLDVQGPVLSLEPNADGTRGLAVVGDSDCEPVVHRTFTAAQGWEVAPEQRAGSYLTPESEVILAGVPVEAPCEDPSAVVGTGGGVVLCGDVAQARTGAGEWVAIADGVVAIGPASSGVAVALRGMEGCDGLAVGTISGGTATTTCTEISDEAVVQVSAAGSFVWVWNREAVSLEESA